MLSLCLSPLCAGYDGVVEMHGLQGPTRIVLSREGTIFVTDYDRGEVVVFDGSGRKIAILDVAADGERVYVTSDKHNAVKVFAEVPT